MPDMSAVENSIVEYWYRTILSYSSKLKKNVEANEINEGGTNIIEYVVQHTKYEGTFNITNFFLKNK